MKKDENTAFEVKHRLVGAAVLIILAVVLLPWILGASKSDDSKSQDAPPSESAQSQNHNPKKLSIRPAESREIDEGNVYVSKIVPVDAVDNLRLEEKKAKPEIEEKKQKTVPPQTQKEQKQVVKKTVTPVKPTNTATKTQKDSKDTKKQTAATKPPSKASTEIQVGWVVQVGVFTNEKGIEKVLQDLKNKNFHPSTTIVKTKKGKGVRIWLGPFAERVEAAKMINTLKQKTGSTGFIRAYP